MTTTNVQTMTNTQRREQGSYFVTDLRLLHKGINEGACVKVFCPFHGDKRVPNLAVYADHVHCYACGIHLTAKEYLRRLGKSNIRVEVAAMKEAAKTSSVKKNISIPVNVIHHYQRTLMAGCNSDKLDYLLSRGLSKHIVTSFMLGYTGKAYVIPYFDDAGDELKITGIKFRRDDAVSLEGPKYWNLPGTQVQWYPYTPELVEDEVTGKYTPIWICEGELDTLLLWSFNHFAYTMTCGCQSMPTNLVEVLYEWKGPIFIAYDMDLPGQEAADKLYKRLKNKKRNVQKITWKEGNDLTERYQYLGMEKFSEWLDSFVQ